MRPRQGIVSRPIENPVGEPVDWDDVGRCADCAAVWAEHQLEIENWR